MAATTAERLKPVIRMAEQAEQEAIRLLGQGQQQVSQAEFKLNELNRYYQDYQQQWLSRGARGVSGPWLMNYQRFLSQMEVAIAQQQRSLAWHQDHLEKLRQQWQQRHARLEGLQRLVERQLQEARRMADRREQKMLDEFCQRQASRPDHSG